jgi:transcriptional regulator with XRE-family HTH domain
VHSLTIGERIKRIREFRKLTQKEVGLAVGFPENSAAIRIAQYESNTRVPKKETIHELARVLNCYYVAIYDGSDLGFAERTMQHFFWLEELLGNALHIFKLDKYHDTSDNRIISGQYNDFNYPSVTPPIAISLNYNVINEFMDEWSTRYKEYYSGDITYEEYFEWKINWPFTCDDGGRFEPSYQWRKAK